MINNINININFILIIIIQLSPMYIVAQPPKTAEAPWEAPWSLQRP